MRQGVRVGIDVGQARVGVALSDPAGILATPWDTVPRDLADGGDLVRIADLVAEREAIDVVVGLPRTLAGDEGPAAEIARSYAVDLARRVRPAAVRLVDERLTSVSAHRALRDSGVAGRRQRAVVDQAAAVLILQVALDEERSSGRPPGEQVLRQKRRRPKTKDGQR